MKNKLRLRVQEEQSNFAWIYHICPVFAHVRCDAFPYSIRQPLWSTAGFLESLSSNALDRETASFSPLNAMAAATALLLGMKKMIHDSAD